MDVKYGKNNHEPGYGGVIALERDRWDAWAEDCRKANQRFFDFKKKRDECARLKGLDVRFGTSTLSPLHHDNRCERCT